jgi:lipoprotein-anchoring transpeptidase ErfK/SrfK
MDYTPPTLVVDISDKTISFNGQVWDVVLNTTKTKQGRYVVDSIYTNASMLTPTGKTLPPSQFGGIIIDLKETDIAVHSWNTLEKTDSSSGCVRMRVADIKDILHLGYFTEVLIKQ